MSETTDHKQSVLTIEARWRELCAQHRATDDISSKLLGLVPLFTAAAIAVVLLKSEAKFSAPMLLASLAGSITTLGLWVWERRNIQTCLWLRDRAADIERLCLGAAVMGQFAGLPTAPGGHGKTDAERIVYAITLGSWLLLPVIAAPSQALAENLPLFVIYVALSALIASIAWRELRRPIKVSATHPCIET